MGKLPINFIFINVFSGFCIRNDNQKHVVRAKTDPIEMEYLLFLVYHVSVEVAACLFTIANRLQKKLPLFLFDFSVEFPDAHTSNFDIIFDLNTSLSNFRLFFFNSVVNFPAQLRILI